MTLGNRLRQLRERTGLNQKEFAAKMKIPNQNVSNYERDFRQPDYATLQKFADFFDVSVDYLLGRTDKLKDDAGEPSKELSPYQQAVLEWVSSREDFSFYESPEELIDMIEQFEMMYERMKKKE